MIKLTFLNRWVNMIPRRKPKKIVHSFLDERCRLEGDLHFSGGIQVAGCVQGSLCGSINQTDSVVFMAATSLIKGKVEAHHLTIDGRVEGPIAGIHVVLHKNARILGNVSYQTLQIEEGAEIDGLLIPMNSSMARKKEEPVIQQPISSPMPRRS